MTIKKPTEERRREIADAAIKILGERGLREFTAANIAAEVGISDGTVFRHFKDMNEIAQIVVERIRERLEMAPPQFDNPLDRLQDFVLRRVRAVATQPEIQSLIFSDQIAHALGAAGAEQVAALRNSGRKFVSSCLEEAAKKGLIRDGLDIDSTVLLIMGTMMGVLFAAKDGALRHSVEETGARCWQIISLVLAPKQEAL